MPCRAHRWGRRPEGPQGTRAHGPMDSVSAPRATARQRSRDRRVTLRTTPGLVVALTGLPQGSSELCKTGRAHVDQARDTLLGTQSGARVVGLHRLGGCGRRWGQWAMGTVSKRKLTRTVCRDGSHPSRGGGPAGDRDEKVDLRKAGWLWGSPVGMRRAGGRGSKEGAGRRSGAEPHSLLHRGLPAPKHWGSTRFLPPNPQPSTMGSHRRQPTPEDAA